LNNIKSKIDAKNEERNEIYLEINSTYKIKEDNLTIQRDQRSAEKDTASMVLTSEQAQTDTVSKVFEYDNLINNLIAIDYLESKSKRNDATIAEKATAKKISFLTWLLILVIIIIDTAPIVVKSLIIIFNYGTYEVEWEIQREIKETEFKTLRDTKKAELESLRDVKKDELEKRKEATIDFNEQKLSSLKVLNKYFIEKSQDADKQEVDEIIKQDSTDAH
jgi:hypothetical protein